MLELPTPGLEPLKAAASLSPAEAPEDEEDYIGNEPAPGGHGRPLEVCLSALRTQGCSRLKVGARLVCLLRVLEILVTMPICTHTAPSSHGSPNTLQTSKYAAN